MTCSEFAIKILYFPSSCLEGYASFTKYLMPVTETG